MGDKLCSIAHNFMSREVINLLNCCDFTYVQAGWTPLHLACKKNQSLLAKLLVSKGADINAKDADGCTALHLACESNDSLAVGVLISAGADLNAKESLVSTIFVE
jgi:ankyrin repeat protein